MEEALSIRPEDRIQKTWIPEGTVEYTTFKSITQENAFLAGLLKTKIVFGDENLLLDVGGREGDIAKTLVPAEKIHLVDPDPTLKLPFTPGKFWPSKIQDILPLPDQYKLIICSHVLGYLGNQNAQTLGFRELLKQLGVGGSLVLFYNTNTGYMGELLKFSKQNLSKGHFDYFEEDLLKTLNPKQYEVSHVDISFDLNYPSYEELARCCWFLFGSLDQDIEGIAAKFLPKLTKDLGSPTFPIEERVTFIKRIN
jgi:hypothetical protein